MTPGVWVTESFVLPRWWSLGGLPRSTAIFRDPSVCTSTTARGPRRSPFPPAFPPRPPEAAKKIGCTTVIYVLAEPVQTDPMLRRGPTAAAHALTPSRALARCSARGLFSAPTPSRVLARCSARGLSSSTTSTGQQLVDIEETARRFGVRLTQQERAVLTAELDASHDGRIQQEEYDLAAGRILDDMAKRDVLLSAIEKPRPDSTTDMLGAKLITGLDYFGTALFACVGVQIAGGEAGMNLVGCTLVGCVAGMGGGTVNRLLYGAARADERSVFWVSNPSFLVVAIAASLLTFFCWPLYCRHAAASELEDTLLRTGCPVREGAKLDLDGFTLFLQRHPEFAAKACAVLKANPADTSDLSSRLFKLIDSDGVNNARVRTAHSRRRLHASSPVLNSPVLEPLHMHSLEKSISTRLRTSCSSSSTSPQYARLWAHK